MWHYLLIIVAVVAMLNRGVSELRASAPESIPVQAVLLQLIDEANVPAREAGVLVEVSVREGETVERGQLLARIDDAQAALQRDRAAVELRIARQESENDVAVRYAAKSHLVAKAELRRAEESVKKYAKSISDTELDRLRLAAEEAELAIEQAKHQEAVAQLTTELKSTELAAAGEAVKRRHIESPLAGKVVQVDVRRGEWVEPGQNVMRVVRLDRLKAEGFITADQLRPGLEGSPITLQVALPGEQQAEFRGRLLFVSPEIDPVNSQLRVWAEIENPAGKLRPGMKAEMSIQVR